MTKTFTKESIIPIQDGWVIVDKEVAIQEGDMLWSPELNAVVGPTKDRHIYIKGEPKVIASIGKRIKGVPLIEIIDYSDIDASAKYTERGSSFIDGFYTGWKASEKKYTEADMLTLAVHISGKASIKASAEKLMDGDGYKWAKEFIKSLQTKIPISVTLEYGRAYEVDGDIMPPKYQLKITNSETNTIIPAAISMG